ncbi:MAG: glycine cleavage system aminomethyltransferase GcvT, partial [Deltaproteobacteria bacterium]|nr:glycine cleavage system aminomethyltransferase GcvT [Deltaproteobacteria bacterium]
MVTMEALPRTILYDRHVALGAKIVEFGGWEMPVQYPSGIV